METIIKLEKDYIIEGEIVEKGSTLKLIIEKSSAETTSEKNHTPSKVTEKGVVIAPGQKLLDENNNVIEVVEGMTILKEGDISNSKKGSKEELQEAITRQEDLIKAIKRAFRADLESEDIDVDSYSEESPFGYGLRFEGDANNNESEWMVFTSLEDAKLEAIAFVTQDLENEPEIFNQEFLEDFMEMSPTDIRVFAGDEAEYYVQDLDNDRMLDEADMADDYEALVDRQNEIEDEIGDMDTVHDDEKEADHDQKYADLMEEIRSIEREKDEMITSARDSVADDYKENLEAELEEDAIGYFKNNYGYSMSDIMNMNLFYLNVKEAAEKAVSDDGVAHFLDRYDGEEEEITDPETNETFYAYGTN